MMWLNKFQSFKSKEELNLAVGQQLKEKHVSQKEKELFKLISRYAVKFPGAAHLKVATMAKEMGCSDKTIRRMINRLAEKHMIQKIYTMREISGGKGANILVILPGEKDHSSSFDVRDQSKLPTRPSQKTPDAPKVRIPKNQNEPSLSLKQKNKNHIKDTAVPAETLSKKIPAPIFKAFSRYFNDAASIYDYYGILLRAKASIQPSMLIENRPEPFIEAWHSTILQAKQGKVKSLKKYLYRAFQQATLTAVRQEKPIFNWLEQ